MSYQGVISRESGDPVGTGDDQIPAVAGAMAFAKKDQQLMSMPEMPHAGEHHGNTRIVGRLDDFIVADRSARLDHGGGTGLDRDQ